MWKCLYNDDVQLDTDNQLKTDNGRVQFRRSSHSIACLDNSNALVVFGGEHRPREPVKNDTLIFDRNRGVWNTIASSSADCPTERLGHVAVGLGSSTMLLHGGRSQVDESSTLGDLYSFDLNTGTWSVVRPKGSSAVPQARNFHAACGVGDSSMYIFGGCAADGRLADLWRFDVRTGAWEELARHPTMLGRGGAGLVATCDGKQLFVIGGFTGQENGEVYRYDVAQNTWEEIQVAQPDGGSGNAIKFTPRSVFGVGCSRDDHILVFGGEVDPSDQGHAGAGMFDDTLFSLDTRSGCRKWDVVSQDNSPCPRGWASSCSSENGLVLHGGIDVNNNRLGDLYVFDYNVV